MKNRNDVILILEQAYLSRSNNLPKSFELAQQALEWSRLLNDKALIGKSLNQLSLYYMILSDFKESNLKSKEAILFFEEIGDEKGVADAKYNIGSVYYKSNNFHLGLVYLIDALKIYKKVNDLYNQSKTEKAIGTIYEYIGDPHNAFKSYKSSIRIARIVGDSNLESNVYNNLSGLLLKHNKVNDALKMIEYAIVLKKGTNDIRGYAFAIYGRGKIFLQLKEFDIAENHFFESIKIHKEMGENMGFAMALNKLGNLYLQKNDFEKAIATNTDGLELCQKHNMSMIKIKNYYSLYLVYKKQNNTTKALALLEDYLQEKESVLNTQTLKVIENYDLINKMNILEREALLIEEKQKIVEKKNKDEEEAVRVKQEFLSIMSHEIRTPLNAITTIVSILDNKVDEENKKMFKSLKFASNNLISIVNDVLDFAKLDSKKAVLETQNINLFDLGSTIVDLHFALALNKNLSLNLYSNIVKSQNYLIDQTKIAQVLSNLVGNAIKFTDVGKIEVHIELIKEKKLYDEILFKVSDTGEGISQKDLSKIFVSFSQIKPVLTRKQGGTGLGLAIVKKIVDLHKSEIKVKSKLEQGSEFYFTLNLKKIDRNEIIIPTNFSVLRGKTAMLVEDTPMNALLMKKLLNNWGVDSEHAKNGKEACVLANQKKFDFILMDIHMPEMNGFEATKVIKTTENFNSKTPIFALTADVMTNENNKEANLFDEILFKPIEIEKLFAALSKQL